MIDYTKLGDEELGALVAEKVMGWITRQGSWYTVRCPHIAKGDPVRCRSSDISALLKNNWSPSTSIAAAWEVVEKMQSMNHQHDIHIQCLHDRWDVSMCHFERDGKNMEWGDWTTDAPTAPRAICIAALRAKEEE